MDSVMAPNSRRMLARLVVVPVVVVWVPVIVGVVVPVLVVGGTAAALVAEGVPADRVGVDLRGRGGIGGVGPTTVPEPPDGPDDPDQHGDPNERVQYSPSLPVRPAR